MIEQFNELDHDHAAQGFSYTRYVLRWADQPDVAGRDRWSRGWVLKTACDDSFEFWITTIEVRPEGWWGFDAYWSTVLECGFARDGSLVGLPPRGQRPLHPHYLDEPSQLELPEMAMLEAMIARSAELWGGP